MFSETVQSLSSTIHSTSTTISSRLNDNYPNLSKNLNDNYSTLSSKFSDNYSTFSSKFNENYTALYSGLSNTRSTVTSTFNEGTAYIYNLPTSIGSQVSSYASMIEPVDDYEERDVSKISPNDNLNDNIIALDNERQEIFKNIVSLYSCKPKKECFKYYDDSVIFEDPLMFAAGLPNLKAQFYGMPKVFVKSTTKKYKILENSPNYLKFELEQKYELPFVGRAIVQKSQITLEFSPENRKIIRHTDLWNGKPIGEGGMLRKGAAKLVSTLVWVPEE
ncbi:16724_t:CDS:2 [Funneliformis geosporum]|uniref:15202_t:CDS:1 n=1 Tax=Funneliformis geosporum TaxID=1117311 RepID=A0A9W4T261_9GLOM|nr:16724_t:CDS:2 [Funneliformis geosporum]CAI2189622.1 15202_t:CDS:2 [Funneliformis geosporum]